MPKNEAQAAKRVAQLRKEIEAHNRRYYEEAAPSISDRDYDRLYQELVDLETQFPQLIDARLADSARGRQAAESVRANHASRSDAQSRQHLFGRRGR